MGSDHVHELLYTDLKYVQDGSQIFSCIYNLLLFSKKSEENVENLIKLVRSRWRDTHIVLTLVCLKFFVKETFFTLKYIRRTANLKESYDNTFIFSPKLSSAYIQTSHI